MIYVLLPYYPSGVSFELLNKCLMRQKENLVVKINSDRRKLYWGECMQGFYDLMVDNPHLYHDNDVVCFMNTDLEFGSDLFAEGSQVKQGTILVPVVYEGPHAFGNPIRIDWKIKSFTFDRHQIDCFYPRGIFLTVKDFRESGGFNLRLPHYLSDVDWSIRQVKRGLKVKVMYSPVFTRPEQRTNRPAFSKLNPVNPWYWSVFLSIHCPKKYLPLNLLKAWMPFWKREKWDGDYPNFQNK